MHSTLDKEKITFFNLKMSKIISGLSYHIGIFIYMVLQVA